MSFAPDIDCQSASAGRLDPTFTGGVMTANAFTTATSATNDIRIYAIAIQPDGKHILAGDFRTINGTGRNYIARVNADGTVDTTFDSGIGFSNLISAVAIQPDGKILVGGSFNILPIRAASRPKDISADSMPTERLIPLSALIQERIVPSKPSLYSRTGKF